MINSLSQDPVAVASLEVKEADQQQEEEVESAEVQSCKKNHILILVLAKKNHILVLVLAKKITS